jgi:hypothetical protein
MQIKQSNWRDSGSLHAVVLLLGWLCAGLQILMAWAKGWNLGLWLPAWTIWALIITDTWWTRRKHLKKDRAPAVRSTRWLGARRTKTQNEAIH